MKCREAKILSVPHILGDLEPGSEQSRQLEAHLASCPSCAAEYETCERTLRYLEAHKPEVALAFALLDGRKAGRDASRPSGGRTGARAYLKGRPSGGRNGSGGLPRRLPVSRWGFSSGGRRAWKDAGRSQGRARMS